MHIYLVYIGYNTIKKEGESKVRLWLPTLVVVIIVFLFC